MSRLPKVVVPGYPHHLSAEIVNWRAFLSEPPRKSDLETIRAHTRTGRPLGGEDFIRTLEKITGRTLMPQKRGPKPWVT